MGARTEQEIAKKVFKRSRQENIPSKPRRLSISQGWRNVPEWHELVRKHIGDKIQWNPLEMSLAGSRLNLNTPRGWKEASIFVYEAYRKICPDEKGLIRAKVDPNKLSLESYIEFFSTLIKENVPADMVTHFSVATDGSEFEYMAEYKYDMQDVEDVYSVCIKRLLGIYEQTPYQDELIKSSMDKHGYTYDSITKIIMESIQYIAYVYNLTTDSGLEEVLESDAGISYEGCYNSLKLIVAKIDQVKETVDFDEIDFWEWLEEIEQADNGIDDSFIYLLRCRGVEDDTPYEAVLKHYEENLVRSAPIIKAQHKMNHRLGKHSLKTYKTHFNRIGLSLLKQLNYMNENLGMKHQFASLVSVLYEEIDKIRKDKKLLHYFLYEIYEVSNDSDAENNLQSFIFQLKSLYNIYYDSMYFDDWRIDRIADIIWNSGEEIFEEIKGDGFRISKKSGFYEKYKLNEEHEMIRKYIDMFAEHAMPFMSKINEIYRNGK